MNVNDRQFLQCLLKPFWQLSLLATVTLTSFCRLSAQDAPHELPSTALSKLSRLSTVSAKLHGANWGNNNEWSRRGEQSFVEKFSIATLPSLPSVPSVSVVRQGQQGAGGARAKAGIAALEGAASPFRDLQAMMLQPEVPKAYSYEELAIFCKLEVQLENAVNVPIKFRLGEYNQVERMEGKPFNPFLMR